MLLIQFAVFEFQKQVQHPVINILGESVKSFVGEDIELFNRLLAQHSQHNSRRADSPLLNKAYRTLGLLVHTGMEFTEDLLGNKNFVKGNRRYKITDDELKVVRKFLDTLYLDFESDRFKHYTIPRDYRAKKGDEKKFEQPDVDINDYTTMKLKTCITSTRDDESMNRAYRR